MGGAIAAMCAVTYPGHVKSLWLISPAGVNTPIESELKLLLKTGKNPLIAETPEQFKDTLDFIFYKKPFIPPTIEKMLGKQSVENKGIKDIVFKAINDNPVWIDDLLQGSKVPTLILWGDKDRVVHVSGAGILASKMTAANSVIMKDTGHLPMLERPKETAEAFLKFQRKI
jgi:pimeloyl-ACP methyl ester carboxylesterase